MGRDLRGRRGGCVEEGIEVGGGGGRWWWCGRIDADGVVFGGGWIELGAD